MYSVFWCHFLDGEYPGCLTNLGITFDVVAEVRGEENYNHLGAIRAVGLSLMSLSMLGSLFFSTWTHKNRKKRVVQMVRYNAYNEVVSLLSISLFTV
jgi:hypothetical protein